MGPAFGDIFTLGCCLILESVRNRSGALTHSWNSGKTYQLLLVVGKEGISAMWHLVVRFECMARPMQCGVGSLTVEQGARGCS